MKIKRKEKIKNKNKKKREGRKKKRITEHEDKWRDLLCSWIRGLNV